MTGYGEASGALEGGRVRIEIRTVNHRYFQASLRLPDAVSRHENGIREALRDGISRGHVSCTVRVEAEGTEAEAGIRLRVDEARVGQYLDAFRALGERFDLPGEPDLALISRYPDILVREEVEDDEEGAVPEEVLLSAVREAVGAAIGMREEEGARLHDDLVGRLDAMASALSSIRSRAPARLTSERDRLRVAVRELTEDRNVNEDRLAQEIAYLAEKWDINEELVRFESHLDLFRTYLGGDPEPVGKRLSFLVQEMHREANTIGSKANDAEIAHRVVAIKEEIERLREQVDNVE